MNNRHSYPLNGADRFQLFFDSVARKSTGIGNVIRAAVVLNGNIEKSILLEKVANHPAILQLSEFTLKSKWYSPLYRFENKKKDSTSELITFHDVETELAFSYDCNPFNGTPVHIDVFYLDHQTKIIFSVNHTFMDHSGMENLLASIAGSSEVTAITPGSSEEKFSFKKMSDSITSALFVASLSGWKLKRLKGKSGNGKATLKLIELSNEETSRTKQKLSNEILTNELSFYLGASLYSLHISNELFANNKRNYFIAVPVDRRLPSHRNQILSNFISFIYFHVKENEVTSAKTCSHTISGQMISQARKKMPEKFSSLMNLFRFIPSSLYSAFINLPTNGHSGTFAFSLLSNSVLENKLFCGFPVEDVTHYAPVISPPGLNIIFNEFRGRLKIVCSFDDNRISVGDVQELLQTIRKNLLS